MHGCRISIVTTTGPALPPPWPAPPPWRPAGSPDPPPHQDSHATTIASACARSVAAASSSELLRRARELLPRNTSNIPSFSRSTCCQLWPAAGCPQRPAAGIAAGLAAANAAGPPSTLRESALACAHRPPSHPEWSRTGRESSQPCPGRRRRRRGHWWGLDGVDRDTTFCCEQVNLSALQCSAAAALRAAAD